MSKSIAGPLNTDLTKAKGQKSVQICSNHQEAMLLLKVTCSNSANEHPSKQTSKITMSTAEIILKRHFKMSNSSPKGKRTGCICINAPISNMNEHGLMVIVLYSCSVTKHRQNRHFLCTSYFQSWSYRDGNIYNTSTPSQTRRRRTFGPWWLQIGCLLLVQPSHSCDWPTKRKLKAKGKRFLDQIK